MCKAVAALMATFGTDYQFGSIANVLCEKYPRFTHYHRLSVACITRTHFFQAQVSNIFKLNGFHFPDSAPGTAIDYCYEKLGIVYSFVIELRDRGSNAFMLPIEEIKPTAIETWNGVMAMAMAIEENMHKDEIDD